MFDTMSHANSFARGAFLDSPTVPHFLRISAIRLSFEGRKQRRARCHFDSHRNYLHRLKQPPMHCSKGFHSSPCKPTRSANPAKANIQPIQTTTTFTPHRWMRCQELPWNLSATELGWGNSSHNQQSLHGAKPTNPNSATTNHPQ